MEKAKKPRKPHKSNLTFSAFVIFNGVAIPVEELTEEQHRTWQENMCRRLSETMSDYYTQHPEEYALL